MVSVLDSGWSGPGSSPGGGTALCSWARHFILIAPLSTQVYKWVLANLMLGVTLQWTSIPSRGGVEILPVASCYRNQDTLGPDGPLGSNTDFTFTYAHNENKMKLKTKHFVSNLTYLSLDCYTGLWICTWYQEHHLLCA